MGRDRKPSEADTKSPEQLRIEYQTRLNNHESISQLAREIGITPSTMRWRLSQLGVVTPTTKKDGSPRAEFGTKYMVSAFLGPRPDIEAKLLKIAKEFDIDISGAKSSPDRIKCLLSSLVRQHSNLHIAEIFGVSEMTIRKWAKQFNIKTLGLGEWAIVKAGKAKPEDFLS